MSEAPKRGLSLRMLIPNCVTILALSSGLTGVRFALEGNWQNAVLAVVVAGIFDGVDGAIARALKASSAFGAALDSLSDVIAFGMAPALILYVWALQDVGGIGWILALAFAVSCALRLARFNANLDAEDNDYKRAGFLTGVPAPVAAGLVLAPMYMAFWAGRDALWTPALTTLYAFALCILMISNIPTYSLKALRIRRSVRWSVLLSVGVFVACLTTFPWITLTVCAAAYLASLPISWRHMARVRRGWQELDAQGDDSPPPSAPQ
ncbi:MAG: phosphatidylcholine/phosphatidylserine synthase [Pseudomonadota bacterium]